MKLKIIFCSLIPLFLQGSQHEIDIKSRFELLSYRLKYWDEMLELPKERQKQINEVQELIHSKELEYQKCCLQQENYKNISGIFAAIGLLCGCKKFVEKDSKNNSLACCSVLFSGAATACLGVSLYWKNLILKEKTKMKTKFPEAAIKRLCLLETISTKDEDLKSDTLLQTVLKEIRHDR